MCSESYKEELARQLKECGAQLLNPPDNVFQLFQILEKLEQVLAAVEQGPSNPVQSFLIQAMKGLIGDKVKRHKNVDIQVSVAYCFAEIMRITAPESPYCDKEMKELFHLMVEALESLTFLYTPNYIKTVSLLESVAKYRSSLIMLDLEMDKLVIEMVTRFFQKIRSNHPHNLFSAMERIVTILIDESEEISAEFLSPLLESVRKNSQYLSPLSWKLGEKILCNCAAKLKPYLVEAVKGMGNDLDSFSEIVDQICKSGASGEQNQEKKSQEKMDNENKLDRTNADQPFQDNVNILDRTNPSQNGGNNLERSEPDQPSQEDVIKLDKTDLGQSSQVEPAPDDVSARDAGQVMGDASKLHDSRTNAPENETFSKGSDHCHSEHPNSTTAQGSAKFKNLKSKMTKKSEAVPGTVSKKRNRKPNSLLRSEEGYDHSWIAAGRKDVKSPRRNSSSRKISYNLEASQSLIDASSDARQHNRGRPSIKDKTSDPDARPICSSPKREDALNILSISNPSALGGQQKRKPKKLGSEKSPADALISSSRENALQGGVQEEILQSGTERDLDVRQTDFGAALTLGYAEKNGIERPKKKRHVITSDNDHKETSRTKLEATVPSKTGLKRKRSVTNEKVPKLCDLDERLVGKRIKVWWPLDEAYYEGVIESFDPIKKEHKVFYTDGDIEILNLCDERWERIPDGDSRDEPEADLEIIGSSSAREPQRKRKSKLAMEAGTSSSRLKVSKDNKGDEATKFGETIPIVAKPEKPRGHDPDSETSSDTDIRDYVVKPTENSKMKQLNNSEQSSSDSETESDAGSPKGGMKPYSAGGPRSNALFIKD